MIKCIDQIKEFKKENKTGQDQNFFIGCNYKIADAILEEFLKRFFAPFFIILIGLTSSIIIISSKDENNYRTKNFIKFLFGVSLIILSEIVMTHSGLSLLNFEFYFIIPVVIFFIIYTYLFINFLGRNSSVS